MFCTITNTLCKEPVVSCKTGHIFEKDALQKYLHVHHKCPVSSEPMTMEDVVEIKHAHLPAEPKQLNTTSIPSLLQSMQNEWDQLMLESYQLKQRLQDTRQQLSHSMYQYDAAIRVIARLTQERDRALQEAGDAQEKMAAVMTQIETFKAEALRKAKQAEEQTVDDDDVDMEAQNGSKNQNNVDSSAADGSGNRNMELDNEAATQCSTSTANGDSSSTNTLPTELVDSIVNCASELSKLRKRESKKPFVDLVSMNVVHDEYRHCEKASYVAHSSSEPGINCMDMSAAHPHSRIVTGGNDACVIVCNRSTKQFEYVLKGHGKFINDVKLHPTQSEMVLSASADSQCKIWKLDRDTPDAYQCVWNIDHQAMQQQQQQSTEDGVIALCIHPLTDYFLSATVGGNWYFHCLSKQKTLLRYHNDAQTGGLQCMQLHPDGQLCAVGCHDKTLKIYDIRTQQIGYTFDLSASENATAAAGVSCLNFNENGYYLAGGDRNGIVNVWDLRKINKSKDKQFLKRIEVKQRVKCVQFDQTGQYLAVGQPNGVLLYLSKKWDQFAEFQYHKKDVSAIRFAQNAKFIVTAGKDNNVNFISNYDKF